MDCFVGIVWGSDAMVEKFLKYCSEDMVFVEEVAGAPANVTGSNVSGTTEDSVGVRKKFANSPVFKVKGNVFRRHAASRMKWQRWSNVIDTKSEEYQEIYEYAQKNPGKRIIIEDESTGYMMYLSLPK